MAVCAPAAFKYASPKSNHFILRNYSTYMASLQNRNSLFKIAVELSIKAGSHIIKSKFVTFMVI